MRIRAICAFCKMDLSDRDDLLRHSSGAIAHRGCVGVRDPRAVVHEHDGECDCARPYADAGGGI